MAAEKPEWEDWDRKQILKKLANGEIKTCPKGGDSHKNCFNRFFSK